MNTRTQIERLQTQINTALGKFTRVSKMCDACGIHEQLVQDGELRLCGSCA